ncbi:hypothetical protein J6590_101546 [Homalodisca vitripennis]|nr:hypothetical protein J6590_101546 [Homalodisca vitripennis]
MADSIVIGVQTGVGEQLPATKQFIVYLMRPADSCNWIISRPPADLAPRSDWSRGGHVIQDGGAHVSRDQKIVVWEKFPHVREKFPAHTLIL